MGVGSRKNDSFGAPRDPTGLETNGTLPPAKPPVPADGALLNPRLLSAGVAGKMAENRSSKLDEASAGGAVDGAFVRLSFPRSIGGVVTLIRPLSDFATQPFGS